MAEVAGVRRSPGSQQQQRKPFSWLQRLYRRPKESDSADGASLTVPQHSASHDIPVLGIREDAASLPPETSSLRPTISTRVPSIASNQAVLDVDVAAGNDSALDEEHEIEGDLTATDITSAAQTPRAAQAPRFPTPPAIATSHRHDDPDIEPPLNTATTAETTGTAPIIHTTPTSPPSVRSSKESPIPSIFTTRTAETQPTTHLAGSTGANGPASILSGRMGILGGGVSGGGSFGAADNASTLTLASSSKGPRRRRSLDTNCSVRALAPGSARNSTESERPSVYTGGHE
ncbi:hypothetical protein PYCC9005_000696 [Savitreella phatthalungensis]